MHPVLNNTLVNVEHGLPEHPWAVCAAPEFFYSSRSRGKRNNTKGGWFKRFRRMMELAANGYGDKVISADGISGSANGNHDLVADPAHFVSKIANITPEDVLYIVKCYCDAGIISGHAESNSIACFYDMDSLSSEVH